MKYTVIWRPAAERKLASIWTNADDRQSVTRAADDIDALLGTAPLDVGESRVSNVRILAVFPLSVYYDVHEADRLVAVWAVWQIRRRSHDDTESSHN
jgi:plasmid stabilization system protein ParE